MRFKARPHLHYAPVPDGTYLGGATTQLVLRGSPLLFRVVDVCLPMLEDGATEDELVRALGSEHARPAVHYLVDTLGSSGLLLDPTRFTAPEPSAQVRARYPETLAHLELVSDDPYAALARLTAATVLLVGPTQVLQSAARGLRRTGVGRVLTSPDPGGATLDAVMVCGRAVDDPTLHASLARELSWLPAGVPVIPVVLGAELALAGPVLRNAAALPAWAELARRSGSWVGAQVLDSAPQPVADALTGALAARLIVDLLAGTGASGSAHVVHGHQLISEHVVVHTLPPVPASTHQLADAQIAPTPEPATMYDDLATFWPRWSGLLEPVSGDDLPQLPLSLRQVRHHGPIAGSVVGWSGNQRSATVSAALEALRRLTPLGGVAAAGPNELLWLLDGALRLLANLAQPDDDGPFDLPDDPDTQRIRWALQRADAQPTVRLCMLPGLDWALASAELPDGEITRAWAPSTACAVRDALGAALATLQATAVTGDPQVVGGLCTDALLQQDGASVSALRCQVHAKAAAAGLTFAGSREHPDLLLGDLPFWSGAVRTYPGSTVLTHL